MSDRESFDDDLGSYSLDDEDQLQPEDTLNYRGTSDLLDEGWIPPDRPQGVTAFGVTVAEQRQHETIDMRRAQEEPEPGDRADDERGRSGDDDLDGDDLRDDDYAERGLSGARRAGRLVGLDNGMGIDDEAMARDIGIDGAGASAEEAAVHIIEDLDLPEDDQDDDESWEASLTSGRDQDGGRI